MIPYVRGISIAALLVAPAVLGASCGERVLLGNDPPPPPPCQGRMCGDTCMLPGCDEGAGDMCPPAGALGVCSADGDAGVCVLPGQVMCMPPKDPCAKHSCGDMCFPPCMGQPACLPGRCDMMGMCVQGMVQCMPPDPCAGHPCGYPCPCDPMMMLDGGCPPPSFCDPMGTCRPGPIMCPP